MASKRLDFSPSPLANCMKTWEVMKPLGLSSTVCETGMMPPCLQRAGGLDKMLQAKHLHTLSQHRHPSSPSPFLLSLQQDAAANDGHLPRTANLLPEGTLPTDTLARSMPRMDQRWMPGETSEGKPGRQEENGTMCPPHTSSFSNSSVLLRLVTSFDSLVWKLFPPEFSAGMHSPRRWGSSGSFLILA